MMRNLSDTDARMLGKLLMKSDEVPLWVVFKLQRDPESAHYASSLMRIARSMNLDNATDAEIMHLLTCIHEYQRDGKIYVVVWSRDCDLCESTSVCAIDATLEAVWAFEQDTANNAEGPWSMRIISHDEATRFVPSFRDRAAEMAGY